MSLAALLLAAIALLWLAGSWQSAGTGRGSGAAAGPTPLQVEGAAVATPVTAAVAVTTVSRSTAPAGELLALDVAAATGYRGRVVTGEGSPVAGMLVRLFRAAPDAVLAFGLEPMSLQPSAPRFEVARSTTAADGRFELLGIAPRGLCCLRLDFAAPSSVAEPLRSGHGTCIAVQRSPAPGEVVDLGDLQLKRGAVVTGRVIDASGAAVAGARVRAGVLPPLPFALAPLERFGPDSRIVVQAPNGLQDVLVLPPWCVDLLAALPLAHAVTRGDGGFALFAVDPGEITLLVDAPLVGSLARQRIPVLAGSARDVGELALPAGTVAEVIVQDTAGNMIAGAEVVVAPASAGVPVHLGEPAGTTAADGHARHSGLPRGAIVVAVRRSPLDHWLVVGPTPVEQDVVVTLPAACALTVAVLDPAGKQVEDPQLKLLGGPVNSGVVELAMFGVERTMPLSGRTQRLDDGRVRITGLLPGSYCLLVAAKGWATASLDVQLQRDGECTLQLRACRPLRVRVVDATSAPVAGATLYMQPRGGERSQRIVEVPLCAGRTGADGTAIIADLPTTTTRVTAAHPLFGQVHAEVQGQPPELLLQFVGCGAIVGRLTDGGRAPAPGRWLAVLERRNNDTARGAVPDLPALRLPDLDGAFTFTALPPGRYRVTVQDPVTDVGTVGGLMSYLGRRKQIFPWNQAEVEVHAGETVEVHVDAMIETKAYSGPGAVVTGTVTIDGEPAAGALVVGHSEQPDRNVTSRVDRGGGFDLGHVPAGKLRVTVVPREVAESRLLEYLFNHHFAADYVIVDGQPRVLAIEVHTAAASGLVRDWNGAPVEGCRVMLIDRGGQGRSSAYRSERTDRGGAFTLAQLPAGSYELRAYKEDYGAVLLRDIAVAAGAATAPLLIELRPVATVSGRVQLSALPRPGLVGITLVPLGGGEPVQGGVKPDGTFEVKNVPVGSQRMEIRMWGDQRVWSAGELTVLAPATKDVLLVPALTTR